MKYSNARRYFESQIWAIRPEMFNVMSELLEMRAKGIKLTKSEIRERIGAGRQTTVPSGSIAILPLAGVIDQKVGSMSLISGGTAVNDFMGAFRSALSDKSVSAIIFDVDSPGGSISGVPEAADEIYRSRGKKPIVAVADPMIASAAYWLSCAADEIVCMPSGEVGSIGVITKHYDYSKANEQDGVNPTYITYGQYKGEGNSDNPLSDSAKEYIQSQVDSYGTMFTSFVAKARKVPVDTVRSSFGEGRMLLAKEALGAGMIDSIATLEQTVVRLAKTPQAMIIAETEVPLIEASQMQDEKTCECQCGDNCECDGSNDTCCHDAECECCEPDMGTKAQREIARFEIQRARSFALRN